MSINGFSPWTLTVGFVVSHPTINKTIKNKLGIGGTIKNNEIYFQGDKRDKIISILESEGHSVKRIGG